jgi:hypothetical protein
VFITTLVIVAFVSACSYLSPCGSEPNQAPDIDAELRVQRTRGSVGELRSGWLDRGEGLSSASASRCWVCTARCTNRRRHNFPGETLCINPGSEYNVGVLNSAVVKLPASMAPEYQFMSG